MNGKFKSIEQYGSRYVEEYLSIDKEAPLNNPYKALLFFFSKSFYRGRRDEISKKFEDRTVATLDTFGSLNQILSEIDKLEGLLSNNGVNNHKDRQMVIDAIRYIQAIKDNNLVRHSIDKIKKGELRTAYAEIDNIKQIGHKLASLFIRDIILLYHLEGYMSFDDQIYCQPVDTWVKQVAIKLEIANDKMKPVDVAVSIIRKCKDYNVSPLMFNAGAWYVGNKSFELLLDKL